MSWLGEEVNNDIMKESEKSDFGAIESGIYKAEIQNAYLVDSSKSDAKALVLTVKLESGRLYTEQMWFKSGSGSTMYTDKKSGKQRYLPSFISMGYLFSACEVDMNAQQPVTKTVKHFNNEIQAGVFEALLGKRIEVGIRETLIDNHQDAYSSVSDNEISYYGNMEGKSGKEMRDGSEPKEKTSWLKMISSKPVKDARKDSKKDKPEASETGQEAVGSW
jgi:hypothetical protein